MGAVSLHAQMKDASHNGSGFLVDQPVVLVLRVLPVTVDGVVGSGFVSVAPGLICRTLFAAAIPQKPFIYDIPCVVIKLKVPVPSEQERTKIIAIGDALSDKIELNQKINENLQQQAFAIFDRPLSNEHLSECRLSQIAIINPKRLLKKNAPARFIDMAHLSTSGSFPNGWEIKPYNGGMRFANGDTLLARITPCLENGKTAYIDFLDENEVAFGSTEYIVLSPPNGIPPEFLYCLARYPAFVDYAVKNMNGSSGRQRVSAETIGQYRLPKLGRENFEEFGKIVAPLFMKMRYNSLENMRLAAIRDALLPKLMAGEIEVSDIQL